MQKTLCKDTHICYEKQKTMTDREGNRMNDEYYVGLDLGTGSLGWAVTDSAYNLVRRHGKTLWGVRLFESANTAEERRLYRTTRRRIARQKWRVQLLQEIFAEEITKVDPGFYQRMKESRYVPEDKKTFKEIRRNFHMHFLWMLLLQIKIIMESFRPFII